VEKVKWTRVLWGGLLAGFVINAFVLIPSLAVMHLSPDWTGPSMLAAAGFLAILVFLITSLITGFYATLRPRYGAGIRTAALTGVVSGLLFCLFQFLAWVLASRPIPVMVVATSGAVTFAALLIATLLGAWVYEKPAA